MPLREIFTSDQQKVGEQSNTFPRYYLPSPWGFITFIISMSSTGSVRVERQEMGSLQHGMKVLLFPHVPTQHCTPGTRPQQSRDYTPFIFVNTQHALFSSRSFSSLFLLLVYGLVALFARLAKVRSYVSRQATCKLTVSANVAPFRAQRWTLCGNNCEQSPVVQRPMLWTNPLLSPTETGMPAKGSLVLRLNARLDMKEAHPSPRAKRKGRLIVRHTRTQHAHLRCAHHHRSIKPLR